MIISVNELKQYITTSESDQDLEAKLQGLELLIRSYTNNYFQKRGMRSDGYIKNGVLYCDTTYFRTGDTIQITHSELNAGLYVISVNGIQNGQISLPSCYDEVDVLVTKIEYPMDVKMGVVNMMKWELENKNKIGIQSETISRHSVTYFDMNGDNSSMGFPKALLGFLKPYMKARF